MSSLTQMRQWVRKHIVRPNVVRDTRTANPRVDHIWKYKFGVECLGPVHAQAYSATPPTYSTVLALARRVEDYPAFTPPDNEEERKRPDHLARMLQARASRGHKEDVLLHMHRPFCILGLFAYCRLDALSDWDCE
jgi:hypothetical protein